MESQGADPGLLGEVVIHIKQDEELQFWCSKPNALAVTWFNTIYFCNPESYDPTQPNDVLLHELVHVTQFLEYPTETLEELAWISFTQGKSDVVGPIVHWWNGNWPGLEVTGWEHPYNPYDHSWVEVQGKKCQQAYQNDPSIPLERPPCNLNPLE